MMNYELSRLLLLCSRVLCVEYWQPHQNKEVKNTLTIFLISCNLNRVNVRIKILKGLSKGEESVSSNRIKFYLEFKFYLEYIALLVSLK